MADTPPTPKAAGGKLIKSLKGHKPAVYIGAAAFGIILFLYIRNRQAKAAVAANPTDSTSLTPDSSTTVSPDNGYNYTEPVQYSGGGSLYQDPGAYLGASTPSTAPAQALSPGTTVIYDQDGTAHLVSTTPATPANTGDMPSLPATGGGQPELPGDAHLPVVTVPPPPAQPPTVQTPPRPPSSFGTTNVFYDASTHKWYRVVQKHSAAHGNALWDYKEYYPPGSSQLIPLHAV